MKKPSLRTLLLLTALFLSLAGAAVAAVAPPDGMCPVMPGHKVKSKFFTDYEGERVYFCCRSCIKAFKKNPQKFLHKVN